jgi:hypothetical protein
MTMTTQQHENTLRDQFEYQLPELLENAKEQLRDKFEGHELPGLLENAKEQLRDQFEENELPELLEK